MKALVILCLLSFFKYSTCENCADTSCTPAPAGASCSKNVHPGDDCCPEWQCSDGSGGYYTVYGKSSSSSYSSGSSFSSQSGSGNMFGGMGGFPGFGGLPGFGLFGR